jgi:hypothetical protein
MKSYACYVHVTGSSTPHLRFINTDTSNEVIAGIRALIHEWPGYEIIDVCDEEDRPLIRYTQADRARLER